MKNLTGILGSVYVSFVKVYLQYIFISENLKIFNPKLSSFLKWGKDDIKKIYGFIKNDLTEIKK